MESVDIKNSIKRAALLHNEQNEQNGQQQFPAARAPTQAETSKPSAVLSGLGSSERSHPSSFMTC